MKKKEDLSKTILHAAMDLFVEQGLEKTSMRNIAERVKCSPGTVYLYFKNKTEIMYTLHAKGFSQLKNDFEVLYAVDDPMARLKALGRVYLKFAIENPALYDLMFVSNWPMLHLDTDDETRWLQGAATFDVLKQTIKQCQVNGHFKGHDVESASFVIWSAVHGMASLSISERIKRVDFEDPDSILDKGYSEFIQMFEKL